MAFSLGDIIVTIKANTDNLQKGLNDVQRLANKTKDFGDKISSAMQSSIDSSKKFALGVAAVGAATIAFGVVSVKAFSDSQDRIAQTNAVLKSTHDIAGITAESVTKLATALERQTKFSDEDVRSVENLLLTFTKIGKDIMPQATTTVLDMATALGEDTKSASIQLGKALQDPILGITALRRVGVNFNEDQKKVIEHLVKTGQSAKAQKLILKELKTEFGGSAVAAGNTYAGGLEKLKNQFNNVQEAIGQIIVKAILPLTENLMKWFDSVGGVDGVMKKLGDTIRAVQPYFPFIIGAIIGGLVPAFLALAASVVASTIALAPWIIAGAIIAGLAVLIMNNWSGISKFFAGVVKVFTDGFNGIMQGVDYVKKHFWTLVGESIAFFALLPIKWPFYVWNAITAIIGLIAKVNWNKVFIAIGRAAVSIWNSVVAAAKGAWAAISKIDWGKVLINIGKGIGNTIIDLINGVIKGAFSGVPILKDHIPQIPHFANGVTNFPGGLAMVGERGAEIVNLPAGTDVYSNQKSRGMLANSMGPTINIGTVNNSSDEEYIMRRIDMNQRYARRGVSPA